MDLEVPKYSIVVKRYGYNPDNNHIEIIEAEVLDQKGKPVSTADNRKLVKMMHKYPIRFEKQ